MSKVRKPKRLGVAMDMTPMVDVAFLLLIFFMLTTTFKPPEKKQVKLPISHSELKVPQSRVILLSVFEDGSMDITFPKVQVDANYKPILRSDGSVKILSQTVDITLADLENVLQTARLENASARMIVKTDRRVPYGAMQDVMAAFQNTNTTTFNVVTEFNSEKIN